MSVPSLKITRNGVEITEVPTDVSNLEDRMTAVEAVNAQQDALLATNGGKIAVIESQVDLNTTRLGDLAAVESAVAALQALNPDGVTQASVDAAIAALQDSATSNASTLVAVQDALTILETGKVAGAEAAIAALEALNPSNVSVTTLATQAGIDASLALKADNTALDAAVTLPSGSGVSVDWLNNNLMNAIISGDRNVPEPQSAVDGNESFYFNNVESSVLGTSLAPAAKENWSIYLEVNQPPVAGPDLSTIGAFPVGRDGLAVEIFGNEFGTGSNTYPEVLFSNANNNEMMTDLCNGFNNDMSCSHPYMKYMPDERNGELVEAANKVGFTDYTEFCQKGKLCDAQFRASFGTYTRTIPVDPTDCWRGFASQNAVEDADPDVAYSQGSNVITVTDGIASYYPRIQYRDGVELATFQVNLTPAVNGVSEFAGVDVLTAGQGYAIAPTTYEVVGGYDDARLAISRSGFNIPIGTATTVIHGGSGYIATNGTPNGTLPVTVIDQYNNAYVGTLATFEAVVTDGVITSFTVLTDGTGYYGGNPSRDNSATAQWPENVYNNKLTVYIEGGRSLPELEFVRDAATGIASVNVVSPGAGFISAPTIKTTNGTDWLWGDASVALSASNTVESITLTQTGGYLTDDIKVTISGDGVGANAYVTRNADGTLSAVTVDNAGSGYTTATAIVSGGRPWRAHNRTLRDVVSGVTLGPLFHFFANSENSYPLIMVNDNTSVDENGVSDLTFSGFSYIPRIAQYVAAYKDDGKTVQDFIDNYYNAETQIPNSNALDPYVPEVGTVRPEFVIIPDNGAVMYTGRVRDRATATVHVQHVLDAPPTAAYANVYSSGLEEYVKRGGTAHNLYHFYMDGEQNAANVVANNWHLTGFAQVAAHEFGHAFGLNHAGENQGNFPNKILDVTDDFEMTSNPSASLQVATIMNHHAPNFGLLASSSITYRSDGTRFVGPYMNRQAYGNSLVRGYNREQRMIMRTVAAKVKPAFPHAITPAEPNTSHLDEYNHKGGALDLADNVLRNKRLETDLARARVMECNSQKVSGEIWAKTARLETVKVQDFESVGNMVLTSPDGSKFYLSVDNDGKLVAKSI